MVGILEINAARAACAAPGVYTLGLALVPETYELAHLVHEVFPPSSRLQAGASDNGRDSIPSVTIPSMSG